MKLAAPCKWVGAMAAVIFGSLANTPAVAEPYLAVQQGYRCVQCHVNPTGGGLRNDFGTIYSKTVMPIVPYPDSAPNWTGKVFSFLRMGGDLRASWLRTSVPGQARVNDSGLDQLRLYADIEILPEKFGIYVDEQFEPGDPQELEAYARLGSEARGWYVKGGRFYLPFGWRLQDNSSFSRGVTGINMTSPDEGVELGFERANWSAQLDVTKGVANSGSSIGDQVTGQFVWVQADWRLGGAASLTRSDVGDRRVIGAFAGLRAGKIGWLGEIDLVHDEGFPRGARDLVTLLGEANWAFAKGQNLKVTGEFFDPDRDVSEDAQTRWSLLYELTPVPFMQLRAGWRNYDGIPQSAFQNRSLLFLELHAFF